MNSETSMKDTVHAEDVERLSKLNKEKKKVSYDRYWDETQMVHLYHELLNNPQNAKAQREFWGVVSILVEKIYFSYSSIQSYYKKYNDPTEEVLSAQSKIVEEIFKSLFIKKIWDPKRGAMFSLVSTITREWYMFYLKKRIGQEIHMEFMGDMCDELFDSVDISQEDTFQVQKLLEEEFLCSMEKYKNTMFDLFSEEPHRTFVRKLFILIEDDKNIPYQKYKRNIYNFLHKRKDTLKTNHFDNAIVYVGRYMKNNVSVAFMHEFNLSKTEDFIKLTEDILTKMRDLYVRDTGN